MDHRVPLKLHTELAFEGMLCHVEEVIGQGSNAIVYKGWYPDQLNPGQRHHVLVKELFPFHPQGKIWRGADGCIAVEPEAAEHWETHRKSFLAGNEVHLRLLADHPDMVGGNLNSFCANGTLYSLLGYSGGRSLQAELNCPSRGLRQYALLMLRLLDALEAFHKSGYLHLDVSPDNIMLVGSGDSERIFLIDFNSAHVIGSRENTYLSCKMGYSAPEVETGDSDAIGFSSDLYSVTAVFYRCLMGRTLTLEEMLLPKAPDGKDSPCLKDMPETVVSMVGRILKKGLHTLPEKRYRSIGQMRLAFAELIDRIDCVGVTHWSLWENGKRSVEELIRVNPSLRYVREVNKLYPIRLKGEESMTLSRYLERTLSPEGTSSLIVAQGGMGKTTLLLHTAMLHSKGYSPNAPAVFYISLNGWKVSNANYIKNQILMSLRFKREMNDYDSAMHALQQLLRQPLKTRAGEAPAVLLLLDGLNEIRGEATALIREIHELSSLAGVRIIATSRNALPALQLQTAELTPLEIEDIESALGRNGLLIPQRQEVMQLLRTPLILSIYIQASEAGKQLDIETEEELMRAYMDALLQKELKQLPEEAPEKWQIDVALNYVLPAIAAEAKKKGHALTERQLLKVVEKCRKILRSPLLRRVFPQWIGHSKDIFGDSQNIDQWFGMMIHIALHQQLGLLIRNVEGHYQICHQSVGEYLEKQHRRISGHIAKIRTLSASVITATVLSALCALGYILMPYIESRLQEISVVTYDDEDTEQVISHVSGSYITFGSRASETRDLIDFLGAGETDDFLFWYDIYKNRAEQKTLLSENADLYIQEIEALCNSGDQVTWSRLPFHGSSASQMITESRKQLQQYITLLPLLKGWALSERAQKFCPDFPALFGELLEADAQVMSKLYYQSCYPHLEKNEEVWSHNIKSLISGIPGAGTEPPESLEHLVSARNRIVEQLATRTAVVEEICDTDNSMN